jgi:hypothetical protein
VLLSGSVQLVYIVLDKYEYIVYVHSSKGKSA